jgi:hypothetical protein
MPIGGTKLLYKATCSAQEDQEKRGSGYVIANTKPAAGQPDQTV